MSLIDANDNHSRVSLGSLSLDSAYKGYEFVGEDYWNIPRAASPTESLPFLLQSSGLHTNMISVGHVSWGDSDNQRGCSSPRSFEEKAVLESLNTTKHRTFYDRRAKHGDKTYNENDHPQDKHIPGSNKRAATRPKRCQQSCRKSRGNSRH